MSTILDDSRNRLPVRMAEVVAVRVRKMTLVAGDDLIGLCGLRAVQKFRVGRVGRNSYYDFDGLAALPRFSLGFLRHPHSTSSSSSYRSPGR